MIQVNPPPTLRIPDQFRTNPDVLVFFEQQRQILFQLWNRTGGSDDAITDIQNGELYETGIQFPIEDDLPLFEPSVEAPRVWRSFTVNTDYTANGYEFIAATSKLTIKFPEFPDEDDIVSILNVNGKEITADGNGKLINGHKTTVTFRKNTTINYHYFAELAAWFMR